MTQNLSSETNGAATGERTHRPLSPRPGLPECSWISWRTLKQNVSRPPWPAGASHSSPPACRKQARALVPPSGDDGQLPLGRARLCGLTPRWSCRSRRLTNTASQREGGEARRRSASPEESRGDLLGTAVAQHESKAGPRLPGAAVWRAGVRAAPGAGAASATAAASASAAAARPAPSPPHEAPSVRWGDP